MDNLLCGNESSHAQPEVIPGAAIFEQVVGNLIICLSLNLFVLPGVTPDVAGNDVADRLKVADVEIMIVRRRRAAPVFLLGEIKTGETGQASVLSVSARIHRENDVRVMFEEGNFVA